MISSKEVIVVFKKCIVVFNSSERIFADYDMACSTDFYIAKLVKY